MEKRQGCFQLQGAELLDTLENNGVRNEINRLILHPLGLELDYGDEGLIMISTNAPQGIVNERIDNFKRKAFLNFSAKRHQDRLDHVGFIIQTKPVFNADRVNAPIADPRTKRLGAIISLLEQVFHICKKRLMESSFEKDEEYWQKQEEAVLIKGMYKSIEKGDFINLINFAAMLISKDDLDKAIDKITTMHNPEEFKKQKNKEKR